MKAYIVKDFPRGFGIRCVEGEIVQGRIHDWFKSTEGVYGKEYHTDEWFQTHEAAVAYCKAWQERETATHMRCIDRIKNLSFSPRVFA